MNETSKNKFCEIKKIMPINLVSKFLPTSDDYEASKINNHVRVCRILTYSNILLLAAASTLEITH